MALKQGKLKFIKIPNTNDISVLDNDVRIGIVSREIMEYFLRADVAVIGSEREFE